MEIHSSPVEFALKLKQISIKSQLKHIKAQLKIVIKNIKSIKDKIQLH